jgi:tetratricopeptide (TPR) repeat protein
MKKVYGLDHLNVAACLNHLADLYYAQGRFAEAEPLCERSLSIMEKIHGMKHPDVLTSLENLSAVYRAIGNNIGADHLDQRAAEIRISSPE